MKLKDEIDFSKETEYDHLAKTIREYDTIITFNWDVLLDDALGRIRYLDRLYQYEVESEPYHIKNYKYPHHYESLLSTLKLLLSQPVHNFKSALGHYIKLHGSVDWNICKNTFCDYHNKPIPTFYPSTVGSG